MLKHHDLQIYGQKLKKIYQRKAVGRGSETYKFKWLKFKLDNLALEGLEAYSGIPTKQFSILFEIKL